MWVYEQLTGHVSQDGVSKGTGYSGFEAGKNNPVMQDDKDVGPIPCGLYTVEPPRNTVEHGPFVLPLTPDPHNTMYNRDGFLCHGDSLRSPGQASRGCIILNRALRDQIWVSGDHQLRVVPGVAVPAPAPTPEPIIA